MDQDRHALADGSRRLVRVAGDGNCLFRAAARGLFGSEARHGELRQQVCDHILKHRERYAPFTPDGDVQAYVARMRCNAVWGDNLCVQALEELSGRGIELLTSTQEGALVPHPSGREVRPETQPLFLHLKDSHYDSVEAVAVAPGGRRRYAEVAAAAAREPSGATHPAHQRSATSVAGARVPAGTGRGGAVAGAARSAEVPSREQHATPARSFPLSSAPAAAGDAGKGTAAPSSARSQRAPASTPAQAHGSVRATPPGSACRRQHRRRLRPKAKAFGFRATRQLEPLGNPSAKKPRRLPPRPKPAVPAPRASAARAPRISDEWLPPEYGGPRYEVRSSALPPATVDTVEDVSVVATAAAAAVAAAAAPAPAPTEPALPAATGHAGAPPAAAGIEECNRIEAWILSRPSAATGRPLGGPGHSQGALRRAPQPAVYAGALSRPRDTEPLFQCARCRVRFPAVAGFSNRQRRLLDGGTAVCRDCVKEQCHERVLVAHGDKTPPPPLPPEPPMTPVSRDAAFERWQRRLAARREEAQRAAAEAARVAAVAAAAGPVFFRSHRPDDYSGGEFACFSNWFPSPFVDDVGHAFANAEQFLMHRKALTMGDTATAALILDTPDPAAAKRLGREVGTRGGEYDDARWQQYREVWMHDALDRKFRAHPDLAAVLLSTGHRHLVEASADDAVWGVGADKRACEVMPMAELRERCATGNLLGKTLAAVRAQLAFDAELAAHRGVVPFCCDGARGVDFELFATLLELYAHDVPLAERAVVCSATRHRWQDLDLIRVFRRINEVGGVEARFEENGGLLTKDRILKNGRMKLDELVQAIAILREELAQGWVLKRGARSSVPFDIILSSPVLLAPKKKDGVQKHKATVDLVHGVVRDGTHGHALMPVSRWCDNDSKETAKDACDSLNDFSPMSFGGLHAKLDGVPYAAEVAMALSTGDGRLRGDARRPIEGSTVDIKSAYRNVPIARADRRLHYFRFLDVDKPIPDYVLRGGQPRDEDLVYYEKQVLPFGWRLSVDYFVRLSKALKSLHLWDDTPGLKVRVPRAADGSRQHDASIYIDDSGLYAVSGLGELAQQRYIELCTLLGIPVAMDKLEEEGAVGPVFAMLGRIWDFEREELRLSEKRLETLKRRCAEMRDKAYCTRKEYDSLVGVLSFCSESVARGRTFMRRLYAAQRRRGRYVRLNRGLKADLSWWLKFVDQYNGVSLLLNDYPELLPLFVDASLEGFGATFVKPDGSAEVLSGRWDQFLPGIDTSQESKLWHITELESIAFLTAVNRWREHFARKRFSGHVDNEAAVTAINSGACRDPGMMCVIRDLFFEQAAGGFLATAQHIDTASNRGGDCPSRFNLADGSRDAAAEEELFRWLEVKFDVPRDRVTEVAPTLDIAALLKRMQKAHRLQRSQGGNGDGDDADGDGAAPQRPA